MYRRLELKPAKSVLQNFSKEKINIKIVNVLMIRLNFESDILTDLADFKLNFFASRSGMSNPRPVTLSCAALQRF